MMQANETQASSSTQFIEALRTFNQDHPQRVRIEGAQRTTRENLETTTEALRKFNQLSDTVYAECADAFSQHILLLAQIKKELTALETRVTKCKERAIVIAEHDQVSLDFLDAPM